MRETYQGDEVDILWLPDVYSKFRFWSYSVWHAHPGDAAFAKYEPICKSDMSGRHRGKVWNEPGKYLIPAVCCKCQRMMDMWEMAE